MIDIEPVKGAEIRKTRPCIIVNDNSVGKLPLKIIVPLTDWKDRYTLAPWMVKIENDSKNGLFKTSAADCFQIRSLSDNRFVTRLGKIDDDTLDEIKEAICSILDI
ncbi:MAG: type II toxin-antitoxin system PemK/MazF family toxin [Prevotellaceae bacterium]|nr:type II toxin-antitoxin system PemK/MazF family toxin [Prevotellaceae bacterium]